MTEKRGFNRSSFGCIAFMLLIGCAPIQVGRTSDPDSSGGQTYDRVSTGGQTSDRVSAGGQASLPLSTIGGAAGDGPGVAAGGAATGGISDRGMGGTSGPCPNALEIRGHIVSPTGQPLQGVQVSLSGQFNTTTLTDEKGQYLFNQVCPGDYTLEPSRADLRFCSEQAKFPNLSQSVDEDFTGSTYGCQAPEITQRLAILTFDPLVAASDGSTRRLSEVNNWQDLSGVADQFRRTIKTVTNGRVQYDLVKSSTVDTFPPMQDGFVYTPASYARCLADSASCYVPEAADYQQLANDQAICDLVNTGTVDEVWLLGEPHFGFTTMQRLGPVASSSPLVPTVATSCMRAINVLGFTYGRGFDAFLRDLHVKAENILDPLFQGWNYNSLSTTWNRYTHVRLMSAAYPVSGCGGHGYPPNASQSGEYDNTAFVNSYCDNFYADPTSSDVTASLKPTNCDDWGCSSLGFDRYWFRHLPAQKGVDQDGMLADWWRYLLHPNDALPKPPAVSNEPSNPGTSAALACSSNYASGWCDNVIDGQHGVCNEGEWATPNLPTGWVEFSWPAKTAVASVTLYDRACDEHVTAGHLEFSDGSPAISFGPLEDTGLVPSEIRFNPKQLTWLRVFIDASEGGANPGFGEITVE